MEKLQIKNFAGLKDVTIEVAPITGFIGPQASGKSVIAKLLYFFREISVRLPAAVGEGMGEPEYQEECCRKFVQYFPVQNTSESVSEIIYETNGENIRATLKKGNANPTDYARLNWSNFFRAEIEKLTQRHGQLLRQLGDEADDAYIVARIRLREEYDAEASTVLGPTSKYDQLFIPAGRSFFSQLSTMVFTRLEAGDSFDPFMVAFGALLEKSKVRLESQGFLAERKSLEFEQQNDSLRARIKKIIHAEMGRSQRQDILRFDDGRSVKLAQASSGQQEVLPLLLLLADFFSLPNARGRAVYIEEPEAHIFPTTQKQIVEFIAAVFRARQDQMNLILTTHSPYILTSINNLLEAGKIYESAGPEVKKRLEEIIPLSQTFKPGEVAFYALENGTAKSIVDSETGLIDAAMIDSVSDEIATQFDELLLEGNEKR